MSCFYNFLQVICWIVFLFIMTSSNGNISRVTGPLCGEIAGHRWIPHTKASDGEFDVLFDLRLNKRLSKQSWGWLFETSSRSWWHHCNMTQVCNAIIKHTWPSSTNTTRDIPDIINRFIHYAQVPGLILGLCPALFCNELSHWWVLA